MTSASLLGICKKQISADETVEIRFYLDREGNYGKAEYDIGYIQVEGKGEGDGIAKA